MSGNPPAAASFAMAPEVSKAPPALVVDKVEKRFGDFAAVRGVSFEVQAGEFVSLLGPSGSGKTTMLSMIAGFVELSSGSIFIDGKDVTSIKPNKRDLGVVFQLYALFPHLTVTANIAYPLEQRAYSKAQVRERVQAALQLVHLEEFENRLPRQLSGGQQQRVALARAIVYEPQALLLDEPLGALDKRLRDSMQLEIARIHRELGMTFVFVTHDQEEALTLSDRIAVFNNGRIEQVGTPKDLYDNPETLFVAKFIGESNIFDGERPGELIVVRPERVSLFDQASSVPGELVKRDATATEVTFVGNHYRTQLRFDDGTPGSAMQLTADPILIRPGQRVTAAWRRDSERRLAKPLSAAGL